MLYLKNCKFLLFKHRHPLTAVMHTCMYVLNNHYCFADQIFNIVKSATCFRGHKDFFFFYAEANL